MLPTTVRPHAKFVAAFALLVAALTGTCAYGQRQTVNVLIDASYAPTGNSFLDKLGGRLQPRAREALTFERRTVASRDIRSALDRLDWEMAIVSNAAMVTTGNGTTTVAFEMPFVFGRTENVLTLQQSATGRAALGMLPAGLTGLVYLNAGVSLLAGQTRPKSPEDLKGRSAAVYLPLLQEPSKLLGMSATELPPDDFGPALRAGKFDSAVISSAQPANWFLPAHKFVLSNSVKANVALVVTRNAAWDKMSFAHRAMIADAAIEVSQQIDQTILDSEKKLFSEAADKLVTFSAFDADRATRQWIAQQPQVLRARYTSIYEGIKQMDLTVPRPSSAPRSSNDAARIRFATTRDDTGDDQFRYRFGDDRTDVVKCGEVAPLPGSSNDSALAFAGSITNDSEACRDLISKVLKASKRMLLFVHGFNNRFAEAAERAMLLKTVVGRDTEVVLWSWPSKRDGLTGNYNYDKESVSGEALQSFKKLLKALKSGSKTVPIDILAHSMGSWHTVNALRDLADDPAHPDLQTVVFAAPDVPVNEFKFALKDMRMNAKRLTLYACDRDWALQLSQALNAAPRAGTGGAQEIIVDSRLDSIDVPPRWLSTNHSYVFEAGKVLDDVSAIVVYGTDPGMRGLLRYPKSPWHYWSFPP